MPTLQELKDATASSRSMSEAAAKLNLHFSTFKRLAVEAGIYSPNRGRKGGSKPKAEGNGKIPLNEILEGKHPQYQTFKLKKRLFTENLKQNKCEVCGIDEYNGKRLECELDHIDGDRTNHRLSNLRILCPNCHSQTHTFRFKRGKNKAPVVK